MGLKERARERHQRARTMHRLVKRENAGRSFDYEFWQNLYIKFRRENLIKVKKAAGRPQDLRDAEDLENP